MAMKKCKECGTEISSSAKVCPNCGKKQKLSGCLIAIIIIILLGIIVGASGRDNNSSETINSSSSENTINSTSSLITKENYDKISNGMSKEEVFSILGEDASITESDTPGVGTMEMYHYQELLSTSAITITFLDGKVYTKNWTNL